MRSFYLKYNKAILASLFFAGIISGIRIDKSPVSDYKNPIYSINPPPKLLFSIICNNSLLLSSILIIGTLTFGMYGAAIVFWNGLNLGVSSSKFSAVFGLSKTLAVIIPHGVLEISLIILAASYSISYSHWLLYFFQNPASAKAPDLLPRKEFKKIGILFLLLLFCAGIEFYITPIIFYKS